jgi:ATP-dependent Clp protease ATP-binding subunit ClpC
VTDRFSESARGVVAAAEEQARNRRNFFVGTEHVLLGLLSDRGSPAARALEAMDVGVDDVRQRVEDSIKPGLRTPSGPIPLTPRVETVLQLAVQEAQLSGRAQVDAADILLGLIREGTGVAAQVLIGCGAELVVARRAAGTSGPGLAAEITRVVRDNSRDLIEAARNGELGPVIGRDNEVTRLVEMLSQYFAPNPVLIDQETAQDHWNVVSGLAMRIAAGHRVPDELEGKRVLAVNLEELAGQLPAGPPDEVRRAVAAEIRRLGDIVFCTNSLPVLTGESAAILKYLLATDEIKLIGITARRPGESSQDVTFERFEPIDIPEPGTLCDIGELKLAFENARYFEI